MTQFEIKDKMSILSIVYKGSSKLSHTIFLDLEMLKKYNSDGLLCYLQSKNKLMYTDG